MDEAGGVHGLRAEAPFSVGFRSGNARRWRYSGRAGRDVVGEIVAKG